MSPLEATNTIVLARRAKEDASVTEMERKSHRLRGLTLTFLPLAVALALTLIAVFGFILPEGTTDTTSSDLRRFVEAAQRWSIAGLLIGIAVVCVFLSDVTGTAEVRAKKEAKRAVKRSRHAAKTLGTDVVPVLTQSHVEARMRVDEALKGKREELALPWEQDESDGIGTLLFEDLRREPSILSLITDRGVITASDAEARLREMESGTSRPIQSGWL